jgi:hypothetical protein
MDPRIVGVFARHDQLLTRRQAAAAGVPPIEVDQLLRGGRWTAVRRGVYTLTDHWESLDQWRGRPLLRARAASRCMRVPHVMSHESAALELGMAVMLQEPTLVHVTRPGVLGSRTEHGVKHHKAPYLPGQVLRPAGHPVLDHARTAVDIARESGFPAGLVAADSALRLGCSRDQLRAAAAVMTHWRGAGVARSAAELADPGGTNPLESLGRALVIELGLGVPETQVGLTDGRREVWCDMLLGRHVFETDGRVKYLPAALGGFAQDPQEVLWEEKARQDFVCGFKLGVSRIVYADLFGPRRETTKRRLLREYHDTAARFGTCVADLEPFRVRRPPPSMTA